MTGNYKVVVKCRKRKTASIYIERDGSLSLLVPEFTSDAEVQAILDANEYRIHKYQAKRELLNERAVSREPVNGQSFLYLGRNYYLQYDNAVRQIEFKGRYLYAPICSESRIKELFKDFYKRRGASFIAPRLAKYAGMMGLNIEDVSVIELKTRWASCSLKRPKVNFHWKVMMAPGSVVDYLIVHELTHFTHKRHNADFWNAVDKYYPDYQKQVAWLKENGAMLDLNLGPADGVKVDNPCFH